MAAAPNSVSASAASASGSGASSAPSSAPPAQQTSSTATESNAISIAQTLPPGFATITQPPQTATSFYKLAPNQPITFGWNLSSVLATPTSITLSAVCENGNTYAVGPDPNGHVPGTATQVVWDIFSYQEAHPATQLAQAQYVLHMWDDRGPTAPQRAGFMSPNTALSFALYTPQPYTPIASGWTCTGCNGALATRPALAGIFLTLLLMIVSGFRVFRTRA
ncbi:hypothetical protein GGX14DRAFT_643839 [Mycena pura]|uniref:DUF7137 domain-containing protein n=1 Tax=Mycena pura TaxID=153505 RepID=A0AAD6V8D8_9AGAR|nr:hypothetical protein GGX14DRAFT_643839 [Mycena pura]